jgi:TetR/AcrR family transcriptional repressor of nem operon
MASASLRHLEVDRKPDWFDAKTWTMSDMGHSQSNKAKSHERILEVASRRFRGEGMDRVGVADLMKSAGLTQGGFYKHFGSRADLEDAAVERALSDGSAIANAIANDPKSTLGRLVDGYLSLRHRDDLANSCAVTSMAGDVARSTEGARDAYTRQVGAYVDLLKGLLERAGANGTDDEALAILSTMVGALSMARAVSDEKLSRKILSAAAASAKKRNAR